MDAEVPTVRLRSYRRGIETREAHTFASHVHGIRLDFITSLKQPVSRFLIGEELTELRLVQPINAIDVRVEQDAVSVGFYGSDGYMVDLIGDTSRMPLGVEGLVLATRRKLIDLVGNGSTFDDTKNCKY